MSSSGPSPWSRLRRPPGRLGVYAPWPLVGVTLLLVTLIVFTPQLISSSNGHQPPVGILTQAELVVDKVAGNSTFHFYVWALGEEIRYTEVNIGVAVAFNWTGASSVVWTNLSWNRWYNGSDVLSEIVASTDNPVALNISAFYSSPSTSSSTWYVGVFAFYVASSPLSGESLYSATGTSGVAVASPLAVSNSTLPVPILLKNAGPGGGP